MRALVACCACFLTACAPTLSQPARAIVEVDQAPDCPTTGTYTGSNLWNGWFMAAEARARGEAIEQAADAKATHVVYVQSEEGLFGGSAVVNGYACR